MTRKFASIPVLHDGVPLSVARDLTAERVIRATQLPNRTSDASAWSMAGGLDNVSGNAYGIIGPTNSWAEWDVVLPPNRSGYAWAFAMIYYKGPNGGTFTVHVEGTLESTIDTYAAAGNRGAQNYWYVRGTAIYITDRAKKVPVRLTAVTKNASATGTGHFYPLWFSFYEGAI